MRTLAAQQASAQQQDRRLWRDRWQHDGVVNGDTACWLEMALHAGGTIVPTHVLTSMHQVVRDGVCMEGTATQQNTKFPMAGDTYQPLPRGTEHGRVLSHAVQTIRSTPEQVFSVYVRPELLPTWQEGVVSVTATGDRTQHWVMQDPGTGKHLEYDAELVEMVPGKRQVSRIVNGPFESTTETALFEEAPASRGTRVTVISDYKVPGGIVANTVGKLFTRSPEQLTIENLRHLKQLVESQEIPSVKDQPAGPRGIIGKWKEFLFAENLPTPPGTSDRAQQRDYAEENTPSSFDSSPVLLGTVAAIVGLAAWYGVRRLR